MVNVNRYTKIDIMEELEEKLSSNIKDLISFLEQYDQKRWVFLLSQELAAYEKTSLSAPRDRISNRKAILRKIEGLFGGMGALNDVFIMIKGDKEKTILINKELSSKIEALLIVISELRNSYK